MQAIIVPNGTPEEIAVLAKEMQKRREYRVSMQLDGKALPVKELAHEVTKEINQEIRKRRSQPFT